MNTEDQHKPDIEPIKKEVDSYARYTGMAFQMVAVIAIFTFAGYKLDRWLELKYPVFTIILILLSVTVSIYSIIRSVSKPK